MTTAAYTTEDQIRALVENEVAESQTLDFKATLPGATEGDRKEFLADVSSFANASGGHIIYGIKEEGGVAKEICGVEPLDDRVIVRLEEMIRTGIAPRLQAKCTIVKAASKCVLVLSIPRSWARPHMVTISGSSKFFSRHSASKFQLDVTQLRSAFTESETGHRLARQFRVDRLTRIAAGETPVQLEAGSRVILHLVPISGDPYAMRFDTADLRNSADANPLCGSRHGGRHNFDGVVNYIQSKQHFASYVQFFRSGAVETVDGDLLEGREKKIPSTGLEEVTIDAVRRYLGVQKSLGAEGPIAVMLSLIGVRDFCLTPPPGMSPPGFVTTLIDRDDLLVPDVLIEDWETDVAKALQSVFDSLWNACGWPGSANYDKNGERIVRQPQRWPA